MSTRLALPARLQEGRPPSFLYEALHDVADGLAPEHRRAFLRALDELRDRIDDRALSAALRAKDVDAVTNALGLTGFRRDLRRAMSDPYLRTLLAAGEANAEAVTLQASGLSISFNSTNPAAVLAARRDVGTLITRIDRETLQATRAVVADMFTSGVPTRKAARRLRPLLGLNGPQMGYVRNFADQLEAIAAAGPDADDLGSLIGRATDRRLDAVTKGRIGKAAREGRLTPSLIDEFTETYGASMRNRRALNVARTESIRASHAGQQESWRQAAARGQISRDARRQVIVTPDDRLRETHAAVPGMNDGGVGLEEPFQTPFGAMMFPPWETNCRCAVTLIFAGSPL